MKHTFQHQSKRGSVALMAAVTFATFTAGTAMAAPPTGEPGFARADISIESRGEEAGSLNCSFRETGLGSFALVSYECRAAAAAVVEGCLFRNKFVPDAGTETTVGLDVSNVQPGHDPELFIANNSGAINGTVITAIPEAPHTPGGGHLCPEPLEQGIVAARWCGTSLTDTTNNLVGAEVDELFLEFTSGAGTVPSCAELLATP